MNQEPGTDDFVSGFCFAHPMTVVAARKHFVQALQSGADGAFVRQLQWGAATWSGNTRDDALEVLNQCAQALTSRQRARVRRRWQRP
jgi:hypothetical protein